MCGLDSVQSTDSGGIGSHFRVGSQVDADIGSPGQDDVQVTISDGEGLANNIGLVSNDGALQVGQLVGSIAFDVGLDLISQSWVEKTTDGRMDLSGEVTQHVLKNSATFGAIGRSKFARSSLKVTVSVNKNV